MYEYLHSEDMIAFEKNYKEAANFLRGCSIRNEIAFLHSQEKQGTLNDWQKDRLSSLIAIFGEEGIIR